MFVSHTCNWMREWAVCLRCQRAGLLLLDLRLALVTPVLFAAIRLGAVAEYGLTKPLGLIHAVLLSDHWVTGTSAAGIIFNGMAQTSHGLFCIHSLSHLKWFVWCDDTFTTLTGHRPAQAHILYGTTVYFTFGFISCLLRSHQYCFTSGWRYCSDFDVAWNANSNPS